jgi:hypothetical protein
MADPATSRLKAIPAALLVVVAIWEIIATRCQATTVPGDDAWAEAASIVRGGYQDGDLIVFAPSWVDPVGRLHLGDLISVEKASRMDAAKYGRIWELSIRGAVAPEIADLTPAQEHRGDVEVRRYDRKPAIVVTDLLSYAPTVGRIDLVEVGFEPHRCIVIAVPPTRPYLKSLFALLDGLPDQTRARMIRAFSSLLPEVPSAYAVPETDRHGKWISIRRMELGSTLAGAFGIADVFTRRDERRDVELVIDIDGTRVVETRAPIDRWVPFFATERAPTGHMRLRWEANPGSSRTTSRSALRGGRR